MCPLDGSVAQASSQLPAGLIYAIAFILRKALFFLTLKRTSQYRYLQHYCVKYKSFNTHSHCNHPRRSLRPCPSLRPHWSRRGEELWARPAVSSRWAGRAWLASPLRSPCPGPGTLWNGLESRPRVFGGWEPAESPGSLSRTCEASEMDQIEW